MDISLSNKSNGSHLEPKSVHGILWLQTHFESNHWESICFELAKKINKLRLNNIQMITDEMNKLLAVLSMEHAKFKVEITSKQELNEFGSDQVTLLVAVNNSSNYYRSNHSPRNVCTYGRCIWKRTCRSN